MSDEPQAQNTLVISDLETLKVISVPLRMKILELTLDQSLTVKQIAQASDLTPSRLYYHIKLLEKHGLLEVASTRLVSGIVEKSYRCTAQDIQVKKELLFSPSGGVEPFDMTLTAIFDVVRADIKKSVQAKLISPDKSISKHKMHMSRTLSCRTPEKAQAIHQRLKEIVQEFDDLGASDNDDDAQCYALLLGMYPILEHKEETR